MAVPAWAPKRKKGESSASFKKRYYHAQRLADESASEKKGDVKAGEEASKIYRKLGKSGKSLEKSHLERTERGTGEDPDKFNKPIRAFGEAALTAATLRGGKGLRVGRAAKVAESEGAGTALAKREGSALAKPTVKYGKTRPIPRGDIQPKRSYQRPPAKALESKKSLPSGQKALSSGKKALSSGKKAA